MVKIAWDLAAAFSTNPHFFSFCNCFSFDYCIKALAHFVLISGGCSEGKKVFFTLDKQRERSGESGGAKGLCPLQGKHLA